MGNYAVLMSGGSIGGVSQSKRYKGKVIYKDGLTKTEAMDLAKRKRHGLSPGERHYYKIRYSVVEIK